MKEIMKKSEAKMNERIDHLVEDFKAIRAGRANPAVLNKIMVEYYGCPTPLNQMASISVAEARVLVITPYDASSTRNIEKAIQKSELGINPNSDGRTIRIVFPQLTEERRKELVKEVRKMSEEAKVSLRSVRRDANDKMKAKKKSSELTEDEVKEGEKKIQDMTDKYCKQIDDLQKAKEKELMEI